MEHGGDGAAAGSVRGSADALDRLTATAREGFGQLTQRTHDDVERLARIVDAAPLPAGGGSLPSVFAGLGAEMNRILDTAADEVAAALNTEAGALASLLGPAAGPAGAATSTDDVVTPPQVDSPADGPQPPDPPAFRPADIFPAPADHHAADDATGAEPAAVAAGAEPGTATDEPPPLPDLSDISAAKGTLEWAEAVVARYPRLTADEVLAIHYYTTPGGVGRINSYLRKLRDVSSAERAELDRLVAHAKSGLAKMPKRPGVTFRGTNLPDLVLDQWQPGRRVADAAFYSSSTDPVVAEGFRGSGNAYITITGHSGADIQQLSHFGNEAEILFQPATELRVTFRLWDPRLGCWRLRAEETTP